MDDMEVLAFFAANSAKPSAEFVQAYLGNTDFHGQDLTQVAGLADAVAAYLEDIRTLGMRKAVEKNFA